MSKMEGLLSLIYIFRMGLLQVPTSAHHALIQISKMIQKFTMDRLLLVLLSHISWSLVTSLKLNSNFL